LKKKPESQREKFFKNLNTWLEGEIQNRGVATTPTSASPENYEGLTEENRKAVDSFMEQLKPDIQAKAVELLTSEIRDKIARSGDLKKIQEAAKKGKPVEIKRKKGCIFLQIGSGGPTDPIEELLIANTG